MNKKCIVYFDPREILTALIYKFVFDLLFLPEYFRVFEYMYTGVEYAFSFEKWIVSAIFFVFSLYALSNSVSGINEIIACTVRFMYCLVIIPTLSVYAFFSNVTLNQIVPPVIFFFIFLIAIKKYEKKPVSYRETGMIFPYFKKLDIIIILFSAGFALLLWISQGMPVVLDYSSALERRYYLRSNEMSRLSTYIFTFLGGIIFPYYFALEFIRKKYFWALVSLVFGIFLFFINGMKTWFFFYLFFVGLLIIFKIKDIFKMNICNLIMLMMAIVSILSFFLSRYLGEADLLAQYARVTVTPSRIGFKSVEFFSSNELLYLRESILRHFFESPYPGGSDFFMSSGLNQSVNSVRENNGLWGDAFRNFGLIGEFIYPFAIVKAYEIVEQNGRHQSRVMRIYIMFIILWSSINTSFFTWLLTGGVIVMILLEKISDHKEDKNVAL